MHIESHIIDASQATDLAHLLQPCVKALQQGELVAFPTETVYGLGANALDPDAVNKIFAAKKRPQDNPLIVHIASLEEFFALTHDVPTSISQLIETYRPGPLTILAKKHASIPDEVTAGLDTVAIRFPANTIAQQLICQSGVPLVAPSANLSGKPSPTRAEHVMTDLAGKVSYIIDGGACTIGIESTIVGCDSAGITIYRQGAISEAMIAQTSGLPIFTHTKTHTTPRAPGMKYKHYAPQAQVHIIEPVEWKDITTHYIDRSDILLLAYPSAEVMAQQIFHDFREADKQGYTHIYVRAVPATGVGAGVMERLRKAANI